MTNNKTNSTRQIVLAAMFLALCMVLPFITGQIPAIGQALSPMHIPVLIAGFVCGPLWAAVIGFIAPLLRFALFGMPPIMPAGIAMAFELCTYGLVSGLVYKALPKNTANVYVTLIIAMLCGRVVWGIARYVLAFTTGNAFTFAAFIAGAFTTAIPGIILHLILIPVVVIALRKAKFID
ncbi:MAG: ECF transporter S component [Erysipelotrichaceae bacterium]|nr:ECF transporter S component [Erysipelotrichaceae bacterium]